MSKKLCTTTIIAILIASSPLQVQAQNISYTTINKKQFLQRWDLSEEEVERYQTVMQTEGNQRYPNLTPYEVLGITAENRAKMQYYAKKAAYDELEAVEDQVTFAILTTEYKKAIAAERRKAKEEEEKKKTQPQKNQPQKK